MRQGTKKRLDITRHAIDAATGALEQDKAIWESCRNMDLNMKIRQFVFKALHNTHHIGEYWINIPQNKHRVRCTKCDYANEDLEHILIDCPSNTRKMVWDLAEKLWPHEREQWLSIKLGTVLGVGLLRTKNTTGAEENNPMRKRSDKGQSRQLRILIVEAAHLIWVLRCEKVIQEKSHSPESIERCWMDKVKRKLNTDQVIASRLDRRPKMKTKVRNTWKDLIQLPNSLEQLDWVQNPEVLVGIGPL